MSRIKTYFVTGLLVLVPLGVTLWVLSFVISLMNGLLMPLVPRDLRGQFPFNLPFMGVLLILVAVFVVGFFTSNFVGRKLFSWWEALLRRIPIVNSIYSSVKQVSDTLFSPSGQAFRRAVLIRFPRDGSWSVGFVVGTPGEAMSRVVGEGALTVYVPTAPNPTSGYVVIADPSEVTDLDISVDDALKFVVSMGVATPRLLSRPRVELAR